MLGDVSQDKNMKVSVIVTLYKNKGDRSDCSTHSGISIIVTVSDLPEWYSLALQKIAERV